MERSDADRLVHGSHLFTVRLWREPLSGGRAEWRARVQHVLSGERRYFREWSALERYLWEKLQELDIQEST